MSGCQVVFCWCVVVSGGGVMGGVWMVSGGCLGALPGLRSAVGWCFRHFSDPGT